MRVLQYIPPSLATALFLLALAGCSNNPYPPGETAGAVLYRSIGDEPKSLDPSFAYDIFTSTIIDVIHPAYFQYHYLKRNPFVLELALGAEMPRREPYAFSVREKGRLVPKTGEAWTFRIKRGVKFQDDPCFPGGKGREVTASDFLFSFRRMADPAVSCPVLSFFEDKIIGLHEYADRNRERARRKELADYRPPISGLKLDPKDPYTFRVYLNQPYPQLRYLMAMHFTSPQAHEALKYYNKEGLARHPVGCGPYRLAEFTPKQRIVLKANPNRRPEYYPAEGEPGDRKAGLLKDAGKPLPMIGTIVYRYVREGITGWNLFLQGYLDEWGVNQTNYQQVISKQGYLSEEMVRKGVRMNREVAANIIYFAFNMDDPVVGGYTPKKRKLRQAISLAMDAGAFIDLFCQGMGRPAEFLIPPGIFGYDPDFRNPYRRYNVEKAKKLLAEAGYPDGIDPKTGERLTIYYDNAATDAAGRQYVGLVTKQFESIGLRLESRSWRGIVLTDRVDQGKFQFVGSGWFADYPDAENFVFMIYGPNGRPGPNMSNYNNPTYNKLFEKMRAMDDGPERLAVIKRMRAIAVEDCPWIFMRHDEDIGIHYDWLADVKSHPIAYDTVKYLGLESRRRAHLQQEWNQPNLLPVAFFVAFLVLGSIPAARAVGQRRHRKARRH
ncbi:MAG: hypothetical protein IT210_21685 [Armatimonadetes bacterium]|nr:hypothetical protein [Armatimonadota bacterium]